MVDRLRGVAIAAALSLVVCAAVAAGSATAFVGINAFSAGESSTQAGGHPDVEFHLAFDNSLFKDGELTLPDDNPCHCDDAQVITIHFPTGFIGNPHVVPKCTLAEFGLQHCPIDAQVGVIDSLVGQSAIYNMEPHPDEAGLTGFLIPLIKGPAFITVKSRTGSDYGLDAVSSDIDHLIPIQGVNVYLWGVPADPSHDVNRFPSPPPPNGLACILPYPNPCTGTSPIAANVPAAPFLENPTSCGVPLAAGADVLYYHGLLLQAEAFWPPTTGCDQLDFNPSLRAQPTTTAADTASGLDVDLSVPEPQSPGTPSPSEIRATTVTLPEGMTISPSAADGKTVCSDEEGSFGTEAAARCPETSKVGTLSIDSSALPAPIDGAIYLGSPQPGDRYRLFLAADGFGTHVKLAGSARPDPQTGRLVVTFADLPQTPFQDFNLHFFGSERGLLATPPRCGVYQVESEFVPWDSVLGNQTSISSFAIETGPGGRPCPGPARPFDPRVKAGTADNTAGAHSPFSLSVSRDDGDQNLSGVTVTTPPGFAATLKGIPYCPRPAAGECPAASLVGVATAGAGAGTHPLFVGGRVYLAGPYDGAPLSLEVVIPAVSGPYDLGDVAVRVAVRVDPVTAQVTAVSDPLPQILDGIPLRTRFIRIDLDRPNFTLNPTNCEPFSVDSRILGDQGAIATPSDHFQVGNCTDFPYGPKLKLKLTGNLERRGHPAVHAVLRASPGEANTSSISVALPKDELLDNAHIGTVCTRAAFARSACPAASLLGTAEALTPLLDAPLKGNVYLRSNPVHELPDLVIDLKGQIDIEVAGKIDSVKGGALRTTFSTVPDAQFSRFTLDLAGGRKGLLQNSESLCGRAKKATVRMVGQNGAVVNGLTSLQVACGVKKRPKRQQRRHHRAGKVG